MTKVLIADDEKIVRDDLLTLIDWEKQGYEIVGAASDGKEAFDFYCRYSPEVVITDIKMPGMDGIELSRRILNMNSNTIVILLTAYEDSRYAIDAVNIGVKRYLLKYTLDSGRLIEELEHVKNQLAEQSRNSQLACKKNLCEILDRTYDDETAANILRSLNLLEANLEYHVIALKLDRYSFEGSSSDCRHYTANKNNLIDMVNRNFGNEGRYTVFEKVFNTFVIIYGCRNISSASKSRQNIYSLCDRLRKSFLEIYCDTVSVGISDTFYSNNLRALYQYYCQTITRLKHIEFNCYTNRIVYEDPFINANYKDVEHVIHDIIECIEREGLNEVQEQLRKALIEVGREEKIKPMGFKLLDEIIKYVTKKGISCTTLFGCDKVPFYELGSLRNINDYINYFNNLLTAINSHYSLHGGRRYSKKIQEAINFIDRNYQRNIKMDDVTSILNMSNGYFCYLFKKEIGESFISYLTRIRIEKAKKMLRETDMKVYEIADALGFENFQYFSLTFKKITNLSPMDYKISDLKKTQ